jgi:pimeloyl-ACP methyl ester carboxylesterase
MDSVGTRDAARDMDVLRAALGDAKLTYLGKSYGSYLGTWYAQLFPDRVRALVLDGAVDPGTPALTAAEPAVRVLAGSVAAAPVDPGRRGTAGSRRRHHTRPGHALPLGAGAVQGPGLGCAARPQR